MTSRNTSCCTSREHISLLQVECYQHVPTRLIISGVCQLHRDTLISRPKRNVAILPSDARHGANQLRLDRVSNYARRQWVVGLRDFQPLAQRGVRHLPAAHIKKTRMLVTCADALVTGHFGKLARAKQYRDGMLRSGARMPCSINADGPRDLNLNENASALGPPGGRGDSARRRYRRPPIRQTTVNSANRSRTDRVVLPDQPAAQVRQPRGQRHGRCRARFSRRL